MNGLFVTSKSVSGGIVFTHLLWREQVFWCHKMGFLTSLQDRCLAKEHVHVLCMRHPVVRIRQLTFGRAAAARCFCHKVPCKTSILTWWLSKCKLRHVTLVWEVTLYLKFSLILTHPLKSSIELARFLCRSWATCYWLRHGNEQTGRYIVCSQ